MDKNSIKKKICLIGAGCSGICFLNALSDQLKKQGEKDFEVVCYEKQKDNGGIWNYSWRVGVDENGEIIQTAMYDDLVINQPKEANEVSYYTWEEHQKGLKTPSFVPRIVIKDYISGMLKKSNFEGCILYNKVVKSVTFDDNKEEFTVKTWDYDTNTMIEDQFTHVVCASGHFTYPNIPEQEGFKDTSIKITHSKDFRNGYNYKDKNVVIIGCQLSAEDLAAHLYKHKAKSVTIAYRGSRLNNKWDKEGVITEIPQLTKIEGRTCYFKDDHVQENVDEIIMATGYKHNYSIFEERMRPNVVYNEWCLDMYMGIMKPWKFSDKLFFLGAQQNYYTLPSFSLQAWYSKDVIFGRIKVPTQEEQFVWIESKKDEFENIIEEFSKLKGSIYGEAATPELQMQKVGLLNRRIQIKTDYFLEMVKDCDHPYVNTDECHQFWVSYIVNRIKCPSILQFRDLNFVSMYTKQPSIPWDGKWLDEFYTMSLEEYYERCRNLEGNKTIPKL